MARSICRDCHVQYNPASGFCPHCGARPLALWRRVMIWRWPLPLAIGLVVQTLSQHPNLGDWTVAEMPGIALVSQFIAGALVFSLMAALLLLAFNRTRGAWRRKLAANKIGHE
jgi:hypothetical protein